MKKMKLFSIFIAIVAGASIVFAGAVTQTATAVNKNLPPSTRIEKMNNGIADVTTTDLPAIIAELNLLSTNLTVTFQYQTLTNAFAGVTNVFLGITNATFTVSH